MENSELNIIQRFKELIGTYNELLSVQTNKTKSKQFRDLQKKKILEYLYGLKSKLYSRNQLSILLDVTPERIRQINLEILRELKEKINEPDTDVFTNYLLIVY